ncbi:MAG: CPBP family glutamic-type intramembrane protease [Bacteroidota bacterium]
MIISPLTYNVFDIIGFLFLVIAVVSGIVHRKLLNKSIMLIVPYTVLGILFVLGLSASYTLNDVTLSTNLSLIFVNGYLVIQNSYLASIGIIYFKVIGAREMVLNYEKSFSSFKNLPYWFIPVIVLSNSLYSWLIFSIFGRVFFNTSNGIIERVQNIMLGSIGAVAEELLIRLFLLGLIVYVLRNSPYKWLIAILLSSIYWALLHNVDGPIDFVRIIQIFPLGVVLGYTMKKYGFEACLSIHLITNIFFEIIP